jgi:hypothetical protein
MNESRAAGLQRDMRTTGFQTQNFSELIIIIPAGLPRAGIPTRARVYARPTEKHASRMRRAEVSLVQKSGMFYDL